MRLPILSDLRDLDDGPRRFARFTAWNVLSWQCLVGPAMVLFARHIEMPPAWVGVLLAALPFAQLTVLLTAPLVDRYGPKRVMLTTWFIRNVLMCAVFAMPLALAYGGNRLGWYLLLASTIAFCVSRAIGAGAWFPWLHEILPGRQRASYFSTEGSLLHIMSVLVILVQALILRGDPGLNQYLFIYALGVTAGFVSLVSLALVPGGASSTATLSLRESFHMQRTAWRDRGFTAFIAVAMLGYASLTWLGASYIMFLRDGLGYTSQTIMILTALGSVAVLATIRYWGRHATVHGSPATMLRCLFGHALVAAGFVMLPASSAWLPVVLVPLLLAAFSLGAGYSIAAHGALLDRIQEIARVGYTNTWIAGIAIALGLTPILAGFVINWLPEHGFQVCFLISTLTGLVAVTLGRHLAHEPAPVAISEPIPEDA